MLEKIKEKILECLPSETAEELLELVKQAEKPLSQYHYAKTIQKLKKALPNNCLTQELKEYNPPLFDEFDRRTLIDKWQRAHRDIRLSPETQIILEEMLFTEPTDETVEKAYALLYSEGNEQSPAVDEALSTWKEITRSNLPSAEEQGG